MAARNNYIYEPTEQEIEEATLRIRAQWRDKQWRQRKLADKPAQEQNPEQALNIYPAKLFEPYIQPARDQFGPAFPPTLTD